jgi:hypothetical protein
MHWLAQVSTDSTINTVTENIPCGRDGATSIVISPRLPAARCALIARLFHRFARAAFRLKASASASTSTFRATERLCHSTVPLVAS